MKKLTVLKFTTYISKKNCCKIVVWLTYRNMQDIYCSDIEDASQQEKSNSITPKEKNRSGRWFYCGQEQFTMHKSSKQIKHTIIVI